MPRPLLILLTLLLWGLTSVHALAQPAGESTPMAQAVAAIKLKPKWQRIEINEDQPKSYRLQLNYKPTSLRAPIVGGSEAAADTTEIARAVLAELEKEGKDPAKDQIALSVSAQQEAGKGPTGKPLSRFFGSTVYDYNTAKLEFRPYRRR
jgi:hypothetical protein